MRMCKDWNVSLTNDFLTLVLTKKVLNEVLVKKKFETNETNYISFNLIIRICYKLKE